MLLHHTKLQVPLVSSYGSSVDMDVGGALLCALGDVSCCAQGQGTAHVGVRALQKPVDCQRVILRVTYTGCILVRGLTLCFGGKE